MQAIAKAMSARERADAADFYAQLDAPAAKERGPSAKARAAVLERGSVLALQGDASRQRAGMQQLPWPGWRRRAAGYPVPGRAAERYLVAAMNAWKQGSRSNDAGRQMQSVVQRMTAEDIAAVASHYAALPPPGPAPPGIVDAGNVAGVASGPAQQARTRPAMLPGDAGRGRAIVASGEHGCAACHVIPGIRRATGIVGPPLGGLAQRCFLAGQLPNNLEVLVSFLRDPPALVPRTGMPNVGLDDREARDIAAFLMTLRASDAR